MHTGIAPGNDDEKQTAAQFVKAPLPLRVGGAFFFLFVPLSADTGLIDGIFLLYKPIFD